MAGAWKSWAVPRGPWRRYIERRLKALVVVSGAMTAAGFLGGLDYRFELFSHFIAWYAVLSLVLLLVILGARQWRWACAAGILMLFQAAFPLSWYWPRDRVDTGHAANCRVLVANVLSMNPDKQSFLDLVDKADPDVVCVMEVTAEWATALAALHTEYPARAEAPRPDNFGIALYSRLPGPPPQIVFQREYGVPAVALSMQVDGRAVQLLEVHALPPLGVSQASRRAAQLKGLHQWLLDQNAPAVVVGDFNLTQYSPLYCRLMRGTGARNVRAGFGPLGTWPVWVPWLRLPLDQGLVQGGPNVVNCTLGPNVGSDHLPLLLDLWIPPA